MHQTLCSPSRAYAGYPHWTMPMCLAILFVLMTTWVELQTTSRSHCRSTPPHPWSLCNGPKSWNNVWQPTSLFHVLATFAPSHSTACSQMPSIFLLSLGVATPLWVKWEDETPTPKVGDLESSGTLECLKLDSKAQNTLHWGVLGDIGKVLKLRYLKWPCIGHLDICSPGYG